MVMTPYEIMLSESQERMLIIVRKGREDVVRQIFSKWDLDAAEIGFVTNTGHLVVKNHGQIVADIPARALADEAPVYQREAREPANLAKIQRLDFEKEVSTSADIESSMLQLLGDATIASKKWVYRQYDHMVRNGAVLLPGSDAAVVRIHADGLGGEWNGEPKYLAMAVDCNAQYCGLDPFEGAKIAAAECCRNLTMTGAVPLALTDNLNFGNPHNPEVFWQLRRSVEGLREACNAFETPVTGGNVSLYNQSPRGAILPTPTVGVVGIIEDEKHITSSHFMWGGDAILLVGGWGSEMGGTAYLRVMHGITRGKPPVLDLEKEVNFQNAIRSIIRLGEVHSAHDLSEGGLAVALAESCFSSKNLGCEVRIPDGMRPDVTLFNESQGRAVLTVRPENAGAIIDILKSKGVEAARIGMVGGVRLEIHQATTTYSWLVAELRQAWEEVLPKWLGS